jgi:hypothetical protein
VIEALWASLSETLENISKATKIQLYPVEHRGRCSEKNFLDYQPSQSDAEAMEEFSEHLSDELELKSFDKTGSLEEM